MKASIVGVPSPVVNCRLYSEPLEVEMPCPWAQQSVLWVWRRWWLPENGNSRPDSVKTFLPSVNSPHKVERSQSMRIHSWHVRWPYLALLAWIDVICGCGANLRIAEVCINVVNIWGSNCSGSMIVPKIWAQDHQIPMFFLTVVYEVTLKYQWTHLSALPSMLQVLQCTNAGLSYFNLQSTSHVLGPVSTLSHCQSLTISHHVSHDARGLSSLVLPFTKLIISRAEGNPSVYRNSGCCTADS